MKTVDGLMENRDFSLIVGFTLLRESSNVIRETEKLRDKFLILPENMTKNVDNLPSKYMDEYIKKLEKEKEKYVSIILYLVQSKWRVWTVGEVVG